MQKDFLNFLVCPLTQRPLLYNATDQELISMAAELAYPIRDGIPIMLPNEARPLTEKEKENIDKGFFFDLPRSI